MKILSIFLLSFALSTSLWTDFQESTPQSDVDLLVISNNEFGYQLYSLMKKRDENLIFSPYNLSTALQMVYAGTAGLTQSQTARVLRLTINPKSLEQATAKLSSELRTKRVGQDELHLSIANSLWVQERHPILPTFKETITKSYKGSVNTVNFQTMAEAVRKEINNWVKAQTQGKIVDLLQANQLSKMTRLLIVSALYMRGKWQNPFNTSLTHLVPFFPSPSKTLTLPTMSLTASLPYLKENNFAIVELPYASKEENIQLSLFILLPHEIFGLEAIESQLNSQKLLDLSRKMQNTQVTLSIPKFKVSSTLSLKPLLEQVGLTDLFSSTADLSGIDGTQDLQVTDVMQKGFLTVDENGTEAGFATAVSIGVTSAPTQPPELFTADHPFLFFVADKVTGTILFLGRVVIPM